MPTGDGGCPPSLQVAPGRPESAGPYDRPSLRPGDVSGMGPPAAIVGFTLIELLLVTAIIGVVAAAIVACVAGGIRVWENARNFNRVEAEAFVGLAIMEKDLRNTFPFHGIPFKGDEGSFSFPGLVSTEEGEERIGTIGYRIGRDGTVLLRKAWPYAAPEPADDRAEPVLVGLAVFGGNYYRPGKEPGAAGFWQSGWSDVSNMPARVRITFAADSEGKETGFERIVLLPASQRAPERP